MALGSTKQNSPFHGEIQKPNAQWMENDTVHKNIMFMLLTRFVKILCGIRTAQKNNKEEPCRMLHSQGRTKWKDFLKTYLCFMTFYETKDWILLIAFAIAISGRTRRYILNSHYWIRFALLRLTLLMCPFAYNLVYFFMRMVHVLRNFFYKVKQKFSSFLSLELLTQICGLRWQNHNIPVCYGIFQIIFFLRWLLLVCSVLLATVSSFFQEIMSVIQRVTYKYIIFSSLLLYSLFISISKFHILLKMKREAIFSQVHFHNPSASGVKSGRRSSSRPGWTTWAHVSKDKKN